MEISVRDSISVISEIQEQLQTDTMDSCNTGVRKWKEAFGVRCSDLLIDWFIWFDLHACANHVYPLSLSCSKATHWAGFLVVSRVFDCGPFVYFFTSYKKTYFFPVGEPFIYLRLKNVSFIFFEGGKRNNRKCARTYTNHWRFYSSRTRSTGNDAISIPFPVQTRRASDCYCPIRLQREHLRALRPLSHQFCVTRTSLVTELAGRLLEEQSSFLYTKASYQKDYRLLLPSIQYKTRRPKIMRI